jgi:SPP1 family phage portal protein
MKTYGRCTILANITEKELLSLTDKELDKKIIDILYNSKGIHDNNKRETLYLKGYYYGDQDIKDKEKFTRDDINNKIVENWAYAFVDFKKTMLLGKPIHYVQIDDKDSEEVSTLNKYVIYEGKTTKDMEIYEDVLVCGRGFRYVNKDASFINEDDQSPFELINCPVEDTEVVYSSKLGNEQLFAYIQTDMEQLVPSQNDEGETIYQPVPYEEYTVYLRNKVITYSNKSGTMERVGQAVPLLMNEHIIQEYFVNRKRISLIEIGKDLFDNINEVESLDKDDLEQFVNSILVFTNAKVSAEDLEEIKSMGALSIASTEGQKASVDLLEQRLNSNDTQTMYNRLLDALHMILGIPRANENGELSTGDTGKAKATGQGYTSATIRMQNDENMIKDCDKRTLKIILKICKKVSNSKIANLQVSQLDNNLQIDQRDNLLVKTQGLMNLYACDIPRATANSIVNLFNDPHQISMEQEKLFGKQVSNATKKNDTSKTSDANKANEQDNKITKAEQSDSQEQ